MTKPRTITTLPVSFRMQRHAAHRGIEFVLSGDHKYPDDYPKVNEEICVVGVFDTYQEGDYTYCTLREATVL